jgi:hypothetical protein
VPSWSPPDLTQLPPLPAGADPERPEQDQDSPAAAVPPEDDPTAPTPPQAAIQAGPYAPYLPVEPPYQNGAASVDGISRNGISPNGISRNGIPHTGSQNGVPQNGVPPNGLAQNGTAHYVDPANLPGLLASRPPLIGPAALAPTATEPTVTEPTAPAEPPALTASVQPVEQAEQAEPTEQAEQAVAPRRRRATKRRLPTQKIFSDLATQAAIPASAYAIGEDVDGAMCLVRTDEGFEVFNSAGGSRHEVRVFGDEESAYFYLFGVLVADAVRTGALAPRD